MKKQITTFVLVLTAFMLHAQNAETINTISTDDASLTLVEASCGQCNFGLSGGGCSLAVRMNGKAYYVDGSKIDDHGDAHAKDGICNAIRKAKVKGEVIDGRFKATHFEMLPAEDKK